MVYNYDNSTGSVGYDNGYGSVDEVVSVGKYLLIFVLNMFQPIGLIYMIVCLCNSNENQSVKNMCKAQLILMAITFVFVFVFMFILGSMIAGFAGAYN